MKAEWVIIGPLWRKLHNKELCNLYSWPSVIKMINSRRMRWAGHVVQMGRRGTNMFN
jgi:hypothetical protein